MSRISKSARKNSEKSIANQILQNKDLLRAVGSFSPSLSSLEDKEIEKNITIRSSSSYNMTGVLPLSQDK